MNNFRNTIFFSTLLILSTASAVDNIKQFQPGLWSFDFLTDYYHSEANHNGFSENVSLQSGNYYQLIDGTLGTRFVFNQDLAFYGSGTFGSAESHGTSGPRTNGSLSQFQMGAELRVFSGPVDVIPELTLLLPMSKTDLDSNDVMNGEGVVEIISKITLQKQFGSFIGFSYVGLDYRQGGRSHLMPYGVGAEVHNGPFSLGGELSGFQSITHDKDADSTLPRVISNLRTSGGSEKFFSVDPSVLLTQVYGKFAVSNKLDLRSGFAVSIIGDHYASGYDIFFGVNWKLNFGSWYDEKTKNKNSFIDTPISTEKHLNQFREDTQDGVDQQIFRRHPETKILPTKNHSEATAPNSKALDSKAPEIDETPSQEESSAKFSDDDQDIKKQLDDAEFQIKLKKVDRNRRKRK